MDSTVAEQSNSGGATVNVSGGGRVVFNGQFRPRNLVLSAGTVEFNRSIGNTRNGTSTTTVGNGTDAATLLVRNVSGSATGTFNLINCSGAINGLGIEGLTIHPDTKREGRNYILGLGANGITLSITTGEIIQRA